MGKNLAGRVWGLVSEVEATPSHVNMELGRLIILANSAAAAAAVVHRANTPRVYLHSYVIKTANIMLVHDKSSYYIGPHEVLRSP